MEKCPSNIAQKKMPGKIAQNAAPCIISLIILILFWVEQFFKLQFQDSD